MGFCCPGTGKSGDLPPRQECAPLWQQYRPRFVLPHPSGRNNAWLKKNPWVEGETLPRMRRIFRKTLAK
jgi:uracil-DNA glycosylase